MEARNGSQQIDANVPLSEMFGYTTDLRSRTQGRGMFTMQFDHYEEVPKRIAEKVIGKKHFGELLEDQIVRPMGAPTLAKESDERPAYSSAEADFAGVKHED